MKLSVVPAIIHVCMTDLISKVVVQCYFEIFMGRETVVRFN